MPTEMYRLWKREKKLKRFPQSKHFSSTEKTLLRRLAINLCKIKFNMRLSRSSINLFCLRASFWLTITRRPRRVPFKEGFKRDTLSKWRCFKAFLGFSRSDSWINDWCAEARQAAPLSTERDSRAFTYRHRKYFTLSSCLPTSHKALFSIATAVSRLSD